MGESRAITLMVLAIDLVVAAYLGWGRSEPHTYKTRTLDGYGRVGDCRLDGITFS